MARKRKGRHGKGGGDMPGGRSGKKGSGNTPIMAIGVVIVIIALISSMVIYNQILSDIEEPRPRPEVIDALGSRSDPDVERIETLKVTLRNQGKAGVDLKELTLTLNCPGVDVDLNFNTVVHDNASKDSFGVGGIGSTDDGWDPDGGNFKVKGNTLVWITIDLTATNGIGEMLGPGQTVGLTFKFGDGIGVTATFKVPMDMGSGKVVPLKKVEEAPG